jgi:hypothetical protein
MGAEQSQEPAGPAGASPTSTSPHASFNNLAVPLTSPVVEGELDAPPLPEVIARKRARNKLLAGSSCILFTRYVVCTFLSAFFSVEANNLNISDTFNGFIFSAYPMGMSITSCFAAGAVRWMGTRTAVLIGLVSTTVLTLLFGFGPDICGMPTLQAVFFIR